ncbi:hypothetical protein LMG24235_02547 [Paraburkholderia sabiae]|uniref:Type III secretion protein (HrpB7) n=1 Tax=Paraburkholderia sabiae TaxID=273251 RepID=A0ABU9Q7W5_9BURK|nr:hypothetical protein [Paraburkholderia sabiae]WJZ77852.1 hypothetical protein QEN71_38065 [Paraburkholderia sabiae]CAD6531852.1 hypothetical protein LMG24235_02547 [Paraburkholderia sabiae]
MSDADDAAVLATLARLKRVREMRSQLARVAAARQQGIAAQSRRVLDDAQQRLDAQIAAKAAIQQRLANGEGGAGSEVAASARVYQEAAADARTATMRIGKATHSVMQASVTHDNHEAELAQLQRAARSAKAAEDKLEKAGERALKSRAARIERAADDLADSFAVRRFGMSNPQATDASTPDSDAAHEPLPFTRDPRC